MSYAKHRRGLGFRDIYNFNQALVAKQSWRIIRNLDSLMEKVLKEIYFKHAGFVDAKIRANPSFIWKASFGVDKSFKKGQGGELIRGKMCKYIKAIGCNDQLFSN